MDGGLPAIVAVGYDRVDTLDRLLQSLRAGDYPSGVPLIISLDWSGVQAVADLAEAFEWPHGPKRVVLHPERLGLREHILRCGDFSEEYGAAIIFEDDIVSAPYFYDYVRQAIVCYGDDPAIAGIALYSYRLNEFNNFDFEPINDGGDVYFLQISSSWGQAWTADQWRRFRAWYAHHRADPIVVHDGLPRQLEAWKPTSWKKYHIKYLTQTGRYFVYPGPALSTNTAKPGTHTKRMVSIYQTPLDLAPRAWTMRPLAQSLAVYDVFCEPSPDVMRRLTPSLQGWDFDVDLMGTKPQAVLSKPYLLSSRPCRGSVLSFGLADGSAPHVGVVQGRPGRFFSLGPTDAFGRLTLGRRNALIRATHHSDHISKLVFSYLKPLQTELQIAAARRQTARTAP